MGVFTPDTDLQLLSTSDHAYVKWTKHSVICQFIGWYPDGGYCPVCNSACQKYTKLSKYNNFCPLFIAL